MVSDEGAFLEVALLGENPLDHWHVGFLRSRSEVGLELPQIDGRAVLDHLDEGDQAG